MTVVKKLKRFIKAKVFKIKIDKDKFLEELLITSKSKKIHSLISPYTMTSIYNQYSLFQAINYVIDKDIEGDIIECGVWKGGSSLLIAKVLADSDKTEKNIFIRHIYWYVYNH